MTIEAQRVQVISDIIERLLLIRTQLRTGCVGQREVWEEWLVEAVAEIERLTALVIEAEKYNGYHQLACLEIERLRAALAGVIEATDLDEVGVIARRALEPKP